MFLIKEILLTLDVNSDTISEKLFKLVFKMNNMGQQGTQEWQTEVFRSSLVRCSKLLLHGHCPLDSYRIRNIRLDALFFRKLEEAIRESGNPTQKPAPDMERQVLDLIVRNAIF